MDDRHGYYFDDLAPGMSAVFREITEADLWMFAGVSGDTNPLHLDEDFASRTMFESRIAHGMLTAVVRAGVASAPGGCPPRWVAGPGRPQTSLRDSRH